MKGKIIFLAALLTAGCFAGGCKGPKYIGYKSINGDFICQVPWGWNVMTDQEGSHYTNTIFIGPFSPEFFLGAPSLSVRWYSYSSPHRLPDGLLESFDSAEDYIDQILRNLYS